MELKSLRCPNCNGPVRQIGDNKFICDSCGTSFVADYDQEDVDIQRIKSEEAVRKKQIESYRNTVQTVSGEIRHVNPKLRAVAIAIVVVVFIMAISFFYNFFLYFQKLGGHAKYYYEDYEQMREDQKARAAELAQEAERLRESQAKAAEEIQMALHASYKVTPEELMADSFFMQNAADALKAELQNNTKLYWTNWVWNEEPQYVTSFLLTAKDANAWDHNILVSVYKVFWDKEYETHTEKYVMYDATCLKNVSLNEDGTIKTDYVADGLYYHNEIVENQFLSGYADYDQLIREEIYGNSDYTYVEFQFPEEYVTNPVTEE